MTIRKIATVFLCMCILASIFTGCAPGNTENTAPIDTEKELDTNGLTVTGNLAYYRTDLTETDILMEADSIVSSGNRIFFSIGNSLYSSDRYVSNAQTINVYKPLEGYTLAILGVDSTGGLLIMERSDDSVLVSFVTTDGSVDSVRDVSGISDLYGDFSPRKLFADTHGNIYLMTFDHIHVISPEDSPKGQRVYELRPESNMEIIDIALGGDGSAYACVKERSDSSYSISRLDAEGGIGERLLEIPESPFVPQIKNGGTEFTLLCNTGDELWGLEPKDGQSEMLFNWVNNGLSGPFVTDVLDVSDRAVMCRYYTTGEVFLFEEGPEDTRTILRLATNTKYEGHLAAYMLNRIVGEFNITSEEYRVVVEDYSQYDEGLLKLNAEVQAGNTPDIIDFANIPAEGYEQRGILVDLYPYIDADPDLGRSDLFTPYISAYEHEGALYQAILFFVIDGFIGKTSVVGAGHSWTLEEMIAIEAQYDASGMGGLSRDKATDYYIGSIFEEYIDRETNECSFNSSEFTQILEYLKTLEPETDEVGLADVLDGSAAFAPVTLFDVLFTQTYDTVFGTGEYTIKGYPTDSKNGLVSNFTVSPKLAITTACPDKDGAWSFLRMVFSEYIGEKLYIGLSASRTAMGGFNAKAMSSTDETFINSEGEEKYLGHYGHGIAIINEELGMDIKMPAVSQEQVDSFIELAEASDIEYRPDDPVVGIIHEELGPFFAGDKTAQQTAEIIQSRVQIYLAEQQR